MKFGIFPITSFSVQGSVQAAGSWDELQNSGLDFAKLLHAPAPAEEEKVLERESSVSVSIHTRRSSAAVSSKKK